MWEMKGDHHALIHWEGERWEMRGDHQAGRGEVGYEG